STASINRWRRPTERETSEAAIRFPAGRKGRDTKREDWPPCLAEPGFARWSNAARSRVWLKGRGLVGETSVSPTCRSIWLRSYTGRLGAVAEHPLHRALGLTDGELERIRRLLQREP